MNRNYAFFDVSSLFSAHYRRKSVYTEIQNKQRTFKIIKKENSYLYKVVGSFITLSYSFNLSSSLSSEPVLY